jgi:hypothetical protein
MPAVAAAVTEVLMPAVATAVTTGAHRLLRPSNAPPPPPQSA